MNRGNDRLITFPSTTFCLVVQQQLQLLFRFLQFISGLLQLDHTSLLFSIATDSLRVEESITPFCCCTISLEFGVHSAVLSTKCAPRICHIDRLFWWRICVCVCVCTCCVFSFCFIAPLSSLAAAEPHSFFTALYRRRRRRSCCCLDMVIRKGSYRRT